MSRFKYSCKNSIFVSETDCGELLNKTEKIMLVNFVSKDSPY